MSSTFLYKLLKHSKWAFVCVILYIVLYVVLMFKKMDTAMFPYNNMYSEPQHAQTTCCYLKINGKRINYTQFIYWKKDFLEQSVTKYADYVYHNKIII